MFVDCQNYMLGGAQQHRLYPLNKDKNLPDFLESVRVLVENISVTSSHFTVIVHFGDNGNGEWAVSLGLRANFSGALPPFKRPHPQMQFTQNEDGTHTGFMDAMGYEPLPVRILGEEETELLLRLKERFGIDLVGANALPDGFLIPIIDACLTEEDAGNLIDSDKTFKLKYPGLRTISPLRAERLFRLLMHTVKLVCRQGLAEEAELKKVLTKRGGRQRMSKYLKCVEEKMTNSTFLTSLKRIFPLWGYLTFPNFFEKPGSYIPARNEAEEEGLKRLSFSVLDIYQEQNTESQTGDTEGLQPRNEEGQPTDTDRYAVND